MRRAGLDIAVLARAAAGAATGVVAHAADDLSVAREALRDGLWDIARSHASRAASNVTARLVVLEAWAGEGKWDEIKKALSLWGDSKEDGFAYYRAVAAGDHAAAAKILKSGASPEGVVEARLFEADALAKKGDKEAADAIWREIASSTNVSRRAFAIAASNLMDTNLLSRAYAQAQTLRDRRSLGLRLGRAMLNDKSTEAAGAKLVRAVVRDSPDAEGATGAFLAIADTALSGARWKEAAGQKVHAHRQFEHKKQCA